MATLYVAPTLSPQAVASRLREAKAVAALLLIVIAAACELVTTTTVNLGEVADVALRFVSAALVLALMLCLAARYVQRHQPAHLQLPWPRMASLVLVALVIGLTLPVFAIFKQLVLPLRGFPLDPTLHAVDRALFLGVDPWRVSHAVLPGLAATQALDLLYTLWMPMMFVFPMLAMLAGRTEADRLRLVCAWLAAWIFVGGVGAWIFGSAGPCYYNDLVASDVGFAELNARLGEQARSARAMGWPVAAIEFQSLLLGAFRHGGYAPAGGISAAPSMHVAMAVLFAIGGFRINRWLGVAMTAFAAAIWVGSVHLGWHYAVDGLISVAAMLAIWPASAFAARWLINLGGQSAKRALHLR